MRRVFLLGLLLFPTANEASAQWWDAGGRQCRELAGAIGAKRVWWGRFSGDKEEMWTGDRDIRVNKTTEACFGSARTASAGSTP